MRLFAAIVMGAAVCVAAQENGAYPNARPAANPTALDRYVAKPDPNYKWELARTEKKDGCTIYTLDMISQQWRTLSEVNRPIWQHWLAVCVPDEVQEKTALLYIDGGSNAEGQEPYGISGDFQRIAKRTGSVTATLYMVPNQPLAFRDMKNWPRFEDSLIAYSWYKFYTTGDEEWPIRLPMTKAAVRAMDAIQEFCAGDIAGSHSIEDFFVCGGSKRGWTTWTTAIVDKRVIAIAPCAIDALNGWSGLHHQWESLGHWSAAMGDYLALGLDKWLNTEEAKALIAIEDPYRYLDRLQMPKFIMLGANDMPDLTQYYWNDLKGPKWLRQVPNAGHPIDDTAVPSVDAFFTAIVKDIPLPNYSFKFEQGGDIVVTLEPSANGETIQPTAVKLWQAHNPKKRDFRGGNAQYVPSDLAPESPNVYRGTVAPPQSGYTAYMVELTYPGPTPETPYRFTSGCRVTPEERPFKYQPPAEHPKGFLSKRQLTSVK